MFRRLLLVFLFSVPVAGHAQKVTVVFEGEPIRKVELSFSGAYTKDLTPDESFEYQVRIVERAGRYYWQTRGMKELIRSESGAYITYHAVDGSGYVRVGTPMLLELRDQLPPESRRKEIGYTEHLLMQFSSITYFGNRSGAPK